MPRRASNATSLFNSDSNSKGENVLIVFNYSTVSDHLTTRVPYDNDSKVLDILTKLLQEFKIGILYLCSGILTVVAEDPESFGLLVENSFWLEADRTVGSYFLSTETACELKPKPWKLSVKFGENISEFEVSPTSDCAQFLGKLAGFFVGR